MRVPKVCRCLLTHGLFIGVLCLLWALPPLNAQINTAMLTGVVSDQSGAAIPAATVTVTEVASGLRRETQTTQDGSYSIPLLKPGTYDVTVSKEGFSTAKRIGLELLVNQVAKVDIALQVGKTTQVVSVTGGTPMLETQTAGLGAVIEERSIVDLPLNGRFFNELLTLSPGVVPIDVSQNLNTKPNLQGGTNMPAVNGQPNRANLYFVDGVEGSDLLFNGYSLGPPLDAIEQFKVQTHSDESELGQTMGGIVNVVTKSGANDFHGAAYEFLRNTDLDARGFFVAKTPKYIQNQFGGVLGGPIKRNKLFFFGYYEGFRSIQPYTAFTRIPTAAEEQGNFTGDPPIYNPYSAVANPAVPGAILRTLFTGNVIPTALLSPQVQAYLPVFVPAPNYNVAGSPYNYLNSNSVTAVQDNASGRIDYSIGSRNLVYGRYSISNTDCLQQQNIANDPQPDIFNVRNFALNWVHTFSANWVGQATLGWNSVEITQNAQQPSGAASVFTAGNFGQTFNPHTGGNPIVTVTAMNVSGFFRQNQGVNANGPSNDIQYSATISKTSSRHNIKFGGTAYQVYMYINGGGNVEAFSSTPTNNPPSPSGTGYALASFILGVPTSGRDVLGDQSSHMSAQVFGFFLQDVWKITPKLTMNYGLRYDYTTPVHEKYDRWSTFDVLTGGWVLAQGDVNIPSTLPTGVSVYPSNHILPSVRDNWGPRLGFAYHLAPKTVVRAGAGVFFDSWSGQMQNAQNVRGAWPSGANISPSGLNTGLVLTNVLTAFGPTPVSIPASPFAANNWAQDPLWKNPYTVEWNFQIQQQLTNSMTLSAAYVGSRSNRISLQLTENLAEYPGAGAFALRAPWSNTGTFLMANPLADSHYESLQIELNKRLSHGMSFLASYTYSKNIDVGCADLWEDCSVQNPYNLRAERGNSALDIPQNFILSYVAELPFGKGKSLLNQGPAPVRWLVSDWQVNGITVLRSGQPYTEVSGVDEANIGGGTQRPNLVGNPTLSNPTPQKWFNTAAFALPAPYTFGNVGRDTLFSDGWVNFDFSVFRAFRIRERHRFEFRVEAFNLFNTVNFLPPASSMGNSATNGVVTSAGSPRDIQVAFHYSF